MPSLGTLPLPQHLSPLAPHATHMLLWQARSLTLLHAVPVVQHACPRLPQLGVVVIVYNCEATTEGFIVVLHAIAFIVSVAVTSSGTEYMYCPVAVLEQTGVELANTV